MITSIRQFSAVIAALLMLASSMPPAQAQDAFTAQENLELFVGDIFEITPSHNLQNPTYTWILTQDRTFIEAGRAQTFRKRLITPGRYTLYAEISGDGQNLSRTFVLDYKARVPGQQPVTASGSAGAIVRTSPPADQQGRVILPDSSQLLRLEPIDPDLRPVIADLDLNTDADGDGDPANDIDTDITFFQTDATPLYVWIAQPITLRPMSVTVARPEGAQQQILEVYSESHATALGISTTPATVTIEETGNRTYSFSASFPSGVDPQTPLLYHWEFGDGQQSLLANPTHQYASEGTYEVKLRIRNLTDGRDIAMYTEQVTVESAATPEPVIEQPAEEAPAEEPANSGMGIGYMLLLAGIFIASILFGIGVIVLLAKMRGRGKSFSDTIEKMEQTIVKKDDKSGNPPPLTIAPPAQSPKPQTPPPEIAQREQSNNSQNPAQQQTPKVEEKNAPAWLKSGLAGQQNSQTPQNPQPPKPQQTPPPAPQQNQQSQANSSAPQQTQRAQGTPPWLQQNAPAPQATMPAAATQTQKQTAPQQNNQSQPKQTPAQTSNQATPQSVPQNQQAAQAPKTQTPPQTPQQNQPKPAQQQSAHQTPAPQTTPQNQQTTEPAKSQQTPPPAPQQNHQSQPKPPQPTGPSSPTNQPKPTRQQGSPATPAQPAQQTTQYVPAWLQTPTNAQGQQGSNPAPQSAQQPQPQAPKPQQPSPQAAQQTATPPAQPAQQNQGSAASPTPSQAPQQQNTPPADQPVAFIRADSLNVPQKENNQNPPPQSGQSA